MSMKKLMAFIAVGLSAATFAAPEFVKGGSWTIENHQDFLSVTETKLGNGSSEVFVRGATNECDTAFKMVSPRLRVPAGAIELVITVETKGNRFCRNSMANAWHSSIRWFDGNGAELREDPLGHVITTERGEYQTMTDWCRVPSGAAAFTIQYGFDHPNLLAGKWRAYRNTAYEFLFPGASREAEFAALWKEGRWARDYFYPPETRKLPKITLRDDGMTLVDGEPFFPIGVYGVCRREFNGNSFDRAFADLKAAGFNFAQTYGNAYEPGFFEAARKYGFKLWVASKTPDRNLLEIGRYEPSVLAWYLGDDTSGWLTPQELFDRNAMVKAVDPGRITCQAESPHTNEIVDDYGRYVRGTDVFMPEIYWIRGREGDPTDTNCVAIVIRDMKRIAEDARTFGNGEPHGFWPILQYFTGWNLWSHFPSHDQLWATSWASIVHGANGIVWYTYGGRPKDGNYGITSTPGRWREMSSLATCINRFIPVLVERTPEAQPTVEVLEGPKLDPLGLGASVTCLMKRHRGKDWLFAVNACPEPVTARITMPDGGVRTERFAAFAVLLPENP